MRTTARVTTVLLAAGVLLTGMGVAPASAATHVVHPGHNAIQKAVDRAQPGDTIIVKPGTYRETVVITKRLTLRGSGAVRGGTVLAPPPSAPENVCNSPESMQGICVVGVFDGDSNLVEPVAGVHVSGFLVRGYSGNGILAVGTTGLQVTHNRVEGNGEYGIAGFVGTRSLFAHNGAFDNHEPGLYMGDSPESHSRIVSNVATGNEYGIFMRDSTDMVAEDNYVAGNCIGIFPLNTGTGAGDFVIRDNDVFHNNKACAAGGPAPPFSGLGIFVAGVRDSLVTGNRVLGNRPTGETVASGGIVLFDTTMFGGDAPRRNVISDNVMFRNRAFDLVGPGTRTGNRFIDNTCGTSNPTRFC